MAIQSICNIYVVTASPDITLAEAARLMQKAHVGSLVVVEKCEGREVPVGIVTDRDLALMLDATSDPKSLKVKQIMRDQPVVIKKNEGIFEVSVLMRENGIERVPVVNEDGSLFGIVCADDLVDLMAEELSNLARIQERQSSNERGVRIPVSRIQM